MERAGKFPSAIVLAALLGTAGPGAADTPGGETAKPKPFIRPNVPESLFIPEKTALLQPECERIATFLARYAAEKYTAGVLKGDASAMTKGRLLLAISQHLQPMNGSAVHCASRWMDGKEPSLQAPTDDLRQFSNFLLSAARRQADKPGKEREALGRVLIYLAAELYPANGEAIYACEIQDRDHKAAPLKEILNGTLGRERPVGTGK